MSATIMCHFTMESFDIIEESKRNIVPEVTRFIENQLLKHSKCGIAKNQLSCSEQDILRDCSCHGCGGYFCYMCSLQSSPAKATMEEMYLMNDSMNGETNMSSPKKRNMFHGVFNALNIFWEQCSKVPASFIASINYPLSVTVVNNEGIIPHDFFKNLTSKKEPLCGADNVFVLDAKMKESLNIVESIHNNVFNGKKPCMSKIFNEGTKDCLNFNYEHTDSKNKDTRSGKTESNVEENFHCNTTNCNVLTCVHNSNKISEEELFEYICLDANTEKLYAGKNCYNIEDTCGKGTPNKEQFSDCITAGVDNKSIMCMETSSFSTPSSNTSSLNPAQQSTVSNLFTNMFQRVFGGVADRFCGIESIEPDMTMKRSFSPKQRRKLNTVAKGRGRGRGRSQLRRSGVSQTRHRKERSKHDIAVDMESDFKSWQDLEMYHTGENKESEDCFSLDEDTIDGLDDMQYVVEETVNSVMYTIADIKPKIQKPRERRNMDSGICKFSAKMRSIPECTADTRSFGQDYHENRYSFYKNPFRPRLISESSIDSEDSYCIVFDAGTEVAYTSDLEESEESDIDQTSDDDDTYREGNVVSPVQKVKFNLNPEIHVMVQWDYAYRAARKGPWEEMARDRERFKGRINCIARVLNPVLTVQHRTHIWQERFARTQ